MCKGTKRRVSRNTARNWMWIESVLKLRHEGEGLHGRSRAGGGGGGLFGKYPTQLFLYKKMPQPPTALLQTLNKKRGHFKVFSKLSFYCQDCFRILIPSFFSC